jgi:hypothetical protein
MARLFNVSAVMSLKSAIPGLLCLLLWTACDEKVPSGPSVALNQQFTLAPGESVMIQDSSLRVQFLRVSSDSRCPADAFCIHAGDAVVHVAVRGGGVDDYELHTGDAARASAQHAGLRIALVALQPYPFSNRTIRHDEYRATLAVSN